MKLLVMLLCQTFFMKQLNFTKKAAREIVLQKKNSLVKLGYAKWGLILLSLIEAARMT